MEFFALRIKKVTNVTDTKTAVLDLIQRIETIERSLKIRTLAQQETSPLRVYLRSLGIPGV